MRNATDILRDLGLPLSSLGESRYYVTCPHCSAERSRAHQNALCLGITIDDKGVMWGCNHCGRKGGELFQKANGHGGKEQFTATYDYVDEYGTLLFQKVRNRPGSTQRFFQRKPNGHGWINNTKDVRKVIYRLPEVIEAIANEHMILCVEGEKDCDNLRRVGVPATCNPDGAADAEKKPKWRPEFSEMLRGADIVIIPDNDAPGYAHARATAQMSAGVAKRVRILKLTEHWPDCPQGGDVSDWLAVGHTREELDALIESAPDFVTTQGETDKAAKAGTWRDHAYTAAALQRMTFSPVSYCVPGLIPDGLTIIAGKPKIGKSWLALDVCIAVAMGRFCLGDRKPVRGDVLYAAMEDNPRRLQRRIDKLLSPVSSSWPEQLTLVNSWRRLDQGGVHDVREWIEQVTNPRLVILDTLAGVKPIKTQHGYTEDYESLVALHRLANEKGVSVIVLHHTRKMEADDAIDTISGTLGLAGCADTAIVLNRTSQGTTLYVRGRDIEEAEHAVSFDKHSCRWTILGNAADVQRSDQRGRILDALLEAGEYLSPGEIASRIGTVRNNVEKLLAKMVADGEIIKGRRGQYRHPDQKSQTPGQIGQVVRY